MEVAYLEWGSWGEVNFNSYLSEDRGAAQGKGEEAQGSREWARGTMEKVGEAVIENELDLLQYRDKIPNLTVQGVL